MTIRRRGRVIDAVAQITKFGYVYVLPIAGVSTVLAYAGIGRLTLLNQPAAFCAIAAIVVLLTFTLVVLLTPANGTCIYP